MKLQGKTMRNRMLILWNEIPESENKFGVNKREQVRRAYMNSEPFQIHLKEYPAKGPTKHPHGTIKEQMAIVLRFVDKDGTIKERFLDMVHVFDTSALTLKEKLWKTLLNHEFDTSKIRGQGYDGASNMRGEWNGLQALVLKDCPYAYYVHCFADRLQVALVAASKEKAKVIETKRLLELGEIKSGKGANQARTLRRAGDTRWGSHYFSVNSMLQMYSPAFVVLRGIITDGSIPSQRADADKSYSYMKSLEFVFILHLLQEITGRTNILSQSLQRKSQDIANAIELVSTTKKSLNDFRNKGWDSFFFLNGKRMGFFT
ncbi:zinc finger MYM-type protein 1-like protein [Tanacetum coccineum]